MSSLTHGVVALNSSTATSLIISDPVVTNATTGENSYTWTHLTLSVTNTDASATVYIGGSGVTSSSYGIRLTAGSSTTISDLAPNMALYAISSASSSNVAVLSVAR
jgi:hypothetical protein